MKICFKHAKTIQIRSLVFGIKVSFSQLKVLFKISIPVETCSFVSRIEASFPESKLLFQSGNLIYNLLNNSNSRFVSNFLLQLRFEASNFFRIRSFELSSLPESKLRFRLEYRSFSFNLWKIQMQSFASNLLLQLILKFRFQNQSFASGIEASFRNRSLIAGIELSFPQSRKEWKLGIWVAIIQAGKESSKLIYFSKLETKLRFLKRSFKLKLE